MLPKTICDMLESYIRTVVVFITNYLPVKVIRDDNGVPFLYRYHLFSLTSDGPGMCIHHFVKSDPDRGYHDHPWDRSMSFILCGRYDERILTNKNKVEYKTVPRDRWRFNYLDGRKTFHRVMIEEGGDAWTIFAFQKRSKTWGMISLKGQYKAMSPTVHDNDGGWWRFVQKGLGIHSHLKHDGNVIAMVDIIATADNKSKVLLIQRGKSPYKGYWAFPGGRIEQKDKDILEAAQRELKEETNIADVELKFVKTIGNNTRDDRGFSITNIFLTEFDEIPPAVKAGDDAVNYKWFSIDDLPDMAFDHKSILEDCLLEAEN